MKAEINGIGDFDVHIVGLSLEDALKALSEARTPKVREAFEAAIQQAKAMEAKQSAIVYSTPRLAWLMLDGERAAVMRQYSRGGRDFWQSYVSPVKRNIRRATAEELAEAIKGVFISTEDLL
jgi:hypothetical protein